MRPRRIVVFAIAVAAATAAAVALATWTSASKPGAFARVSNSGRVVRLRPDALTRRLGVDKASMLAVRGGRAYYLLATDKGPCAAVGMPDKPEQLGAAQCPQGHFPTPDHPVLDLSVYESTSHEEHQISLYRAEGIAADGVAAVQFLRPDGTPALTVPVTGNVYSTTAVPTGAIAGVAALDKNGKRVWRSPSSP
jgi:hypothetical protein